MKAGSYNAKKSLNNCLQQKKSIRTLGGTPSTTVLFSAADSAATGCLPHLLPLPEILANLQEAICQVLFSCIVCYNSFTF
jgi:hypothetical protein